ncbi:MAG: arylsulfotransferase family protein [Nocardiopsaceae bacterium]|nr:arylsulfotransferase family protein [Nocardiopsaceae bacterium]
MTSREWTRRQAIGRGGALIAGASGLATPLLTRPRVSSGPSGHASATTTDTTSTQLYWSFVSRPDLQPPIVTVTKANSSQRPQSGYVFTTPHAYPQASPGQPSGCMIMDWDGELVWYSPPADTGTNVVCNNLSAQSYQGKPVLTWYNGHQLFAGTTQYDAGTFTIADETYTPIATVSGFGDYTANMHECLLTSRGTAYITVTRQATADLTPIYGPANGQALDSGVQEIDIATGDLLFQWSGLDHIPVEETYGAYRSTGPVDPYHFNSIAVAPDGNLLLCSRHTWTVYKISPATGAIIWRLGGKQSDFTMGSGADFAWQHHARPHGPKGTVISIFDDEAQSTRVQEASQSRAIFLQLDTTSMQASLLRSYTRPDGALADSEGSVQLLDGGRVLVGWGSQPYLTEFSLDGQVLLDGLLPDLGGTPDAFFQSYRTLNFPWSATPAEIPAAAVRPGGTSSSVAYASWNGATEVARWTVLAGPRPTALAPAGSRDRTGFETAIPAASAGPYFVAVAEDSRGRELGRSAPVTLPAS